MEPRNAILWTLLVVLVVLAMSAGVQAEEIREVPASKILEQIQAGEDVCLENVRITGEFNMSKIELETVPIAREAWKIRNYGLEDELKIVESEIEITNSVFENNVDFSNTQFKKILNFYNSSFLGISDFRGVCFDDDVSFVSARFWYYVSFISTSFGDYVSFAGASFGGDAYFWGASFGDYVSFAGASFGGNASFVYTKFNKVFFLNTAFTNVSFYDVDFKTMNVDWASFSDVLVFDGPTYIKLIKNFREMEQFKDADDAYYQYRRLSQANKEWSFSKLGDVFMWLSCGYGVKPQYTTILAVIVILIFTIIYWFGNGIRRLKESDEMEYLFSWDDVPGKDNEGLIRYLGSNFGIDQAENVEILKSDDDKTIYIHNDDESAKIMIDEKEEKATLKTSDRETHHLKVKKENGELNIYEKSNEDVSFCDAFYFSVVTFTTVGYGDWYPKDRYRKFVMIEGLVGWLTLALFLVTLANVMIRP
ncbi:MAG: hypothetical protein C4B59_04545 [Candidatus Methanogaster sp.]|uniref:Uncharacterized protein n=1 Tax=Candidatus Methanogaster sp. TaxID=3386292 RepID=A0AC61L5A8_9EURY|nr:MAG: hypothetical protein C4B59_04545 [ANME-2 cluster archaeon]